ncbi:MAG: hypothetical protein KF858_09430 [Candidatus Sumerlaeia bacterium]|nr:hypothetical protein [Candidatus Sumerlaeia bacterium]
MIRRLLVAAAFLLAAVNGWARSPLDVVPPGSNFVMVLDVVQAVNHPVTQRLVEAHLRGSDRQYLDGVKDALGIDLAKDLDHVVLFGSTADMQRLNVAVLGRFDPTKLIAIASLTPGYAKVQVEGHDVHHLPQSDKPFVAFPADGVMVAANSQQDLAGIYGALAGKAVDRAAFATGERLAADGPTVWLCAAQPDLRSYNLPGILGQATYEAIAATVTLADAGVRLVAEIKVREPEYASQMQLGAYGLVALAQMGMRPDDPKRALLSRLLIEPGGEPGGLRVSLTVPYENVPGLAKEAQPASEQATPIE